MVKIDIPKSKIDFEIGGTNFVLSLEDKSRGKCLEVFDKISAKEVENINKRDIEITQYNQEQANLKAHAATDEEMTEVSYKEASVSLSNKFSKMMKKNDANRNKRLLELECEYLDTCFGQGSAKKIYEMCDGSSVVFNKVIIMINNEIDKETSATDFYDSYKQKIEEMKPDESTDQEQTDIQESDVSH